MISLAGSVRLEDVRTQRPLIQNYAKAEILFIKTKYLFARTENISIKAKVLIKDGVLFCAHEHICVYAHIFT